MRRSVVIAIGLAFGAAMAGVVNAALVVLLPDALRGEPIVWGTTAVVIALTITVCWVLLAYRRP
jgi:hypothetical protein